MSIHQREERKKKENKEHTLVYVVEIQGTFESFVSTPILFSKEIFPFFKISFLIP